MAALPIEPFLLGSAAHACVDWILFACLAHAVAYGFFFSPRRNTLPAGILFLAVAAFATRRTWPLPALT